MRKTEVFSIKYVELLMPYGYLIVTVSGIRNIQCLISMLIFKYNASADVYFFLRLLLIEYLVLKYAVCNLQFLKYSSYNFIKNC